MYREKTATSVAAVSALVSCFSFAAVAPAFADASMDATDDVFWTLTANINDGQEASFIELMSEMVAATKMEAGTKSYEWFRDGNQVSILERYETNDDAGMHLGNFGANFSERFMTVLSPTSIQVYGPAEGEVREGLAAFGAVFNGQIGGFVRY